MTIYNWLTLLGVPSMLTALMIPLSCHSDRAKRVEESYPVYQSAFLKGSALS